MAAVDHLAIEGCDHRLVAATDLRFGVGGAGCASSRKNGGSDEERANHGGFLGIEWEASVSGGSGQRSKQKTVAVCAELLQMLRRSEREGCAVYWIRIKTPSASNSASMSSAVTPARSSRRWERPGRLVSLDESGHLQSPPQSKHRIGYIGTHSLLRRNFEHPTAWGELQFDLDPLG